MRTSQGKYSLAFGRSGIGREIASKSDKSRLFGLGKGPAGQEGGFAVGTNAKKVASRALRVYSSAARQAKWKSRLSGFFFKEKPPCTPIIWTTLIPKLLESSLSERR